MPENEIVKNLHPLETQVLLYFKENEIISLEQSIEKLLFNSGQFNQSMAWLLSKHLPKTRRVLTMPLRARWRRFAKRKERNSWHGRTPSKDMPPRRKVKRLVSNLRWSTWVIRQRTTTRRLLVAVVRRVSSSSKGWGTCVDINIYKVANMDTTTTPINVDLCWDMGSIAY